MSCWSGSEVAVSTVLAVAAVEELEAVAVLVAVDDDACAEVDGSDAAGTQEEVVGRTKFSS